MARQPRIDLAGIPQHIIQRGNNREACFFAVADRQRYLKWLHMAAESYGGIVHAYVLMTNHVHLLATGAEQGSLSRMMQSLGRRYVRYVNSNYDRTGTLWEGRYRSGPVDSDRYLLTCYRYIELNPVRAGFAKAPGEYRWSSFHHNARGARGDVVTPHTTYLSLGKSDAARLGRPRKKYSDPISECVFVLIGKVRSMVENIFLCDRSSVASTSRMRRYS